MDISSALDRLANYRIRNSRASRDVFETGIPFLNNAQSKFGDESGPFLEQLALASIDVGRIDIAEDCFTQLTAKFPGSPRVECLEGILKEATASPEDALAFYEKILDADPSNAVRVVSGMSSCLPSNCTGLLQAAWKRQISVLRRLGSIDRVVEELSTLLDTFYTDVEGWLELADIYASCGQYSHALQSLSHVLLLAPQNPFYVLQAAETAYTSGDLPLAIKFFLMVVDMTDEVEGSPEDFNPTGITVRAWHGVELTARRLQKEPRLASSSASNTSSPQHLPVLEKLAKDMLTKAHST
ncbi:TPR-like protein [Artomyces pyxidatus]|uniref:TPR-like protein n=1 Tax=Artomyces pyxidatus TaxID=48021 RepID=A0ACB8SWG7_9AGAM|nr:TPR-like protein [Artomyces pyxidatus]